MKRIGLLLSCDPNYGGTFQYCLNVLDALASLPRSKFKSVIAYIDPIWRSYLKRYHWMEIHDLGNEEDPVPAIDLWVLPSQEGWDFQRKVPVLTAIHDLMHRYESRFPEVSADGQYELREEIFRNICKWSAGVLVDSNVGRRHVQESYGLPLEDIFVLPFIPPSYIYHNKTPRDFHAKYKLPNKYIFYPGHFWRHKNHINLIMAVALLSEKHPDIHLVFTGLEKDGFQNIVQLVEDMDLEERVHFLPYVPNKYIPEFYKRARAMVMPTFFGPTNIPPLEAFVTGCPTAISGIYGIPEQVGDAALLFDPESVEEIAECVRRLWTDDALCRRLITKAKKRVGNWGQDQFNEKFLDIVLQLTVN